MPKHESESTCSHHPKSNEGSSSHHADHSHGVAHGNGHHHHHSISDNLRLAFVLNLIFSIIELVGGFLTSSVAVTADGMHDLGDAISIGLALFLEKVSTQKATSDFSYGYRRFSLLSALITGGVLIGGSSIIVFEALSRFWQPHEPNSLGMLGLSVLGLGVNGYAAFRVSKGKTQAEKVISLHLLEDFLGWLAVLVGSILIRVFHWAWVDPVLALAIAGFVLWNVVGHIKTTLLLFLQKTPDDVNLEKLKHELSQIETVQNIHDLHCWSLDGQQNVISLHAVLNTKLLANQTDGLAESIKTLASQTKNRIRHELEHLGHFHSTIEIEFDNEVCTIDCAKES